MAEGEANNIPFVLVVHSWRHPKELTVTDIDKLCAEGVTLQVCSGCSTPVERIMHVIPRKGMSMADEVRVISEILRRTVH